MGSKRIKLISDTVVALFIGVQQWKQLQFCWSYLSAYRATVKIFKMKVTHPAHVNK